MLKKQWRHIKSWREWDKSEDYKDGLFEGIILGFSIGFIGIIFSFLIH